jgi:hypothetical protein
MLTAAGANFGLRRTAPHILGVTAGFGVLVSAACGGVAVLFTRWPPVHSALKWVGAAYLLFLGWQILRSRGAAGGSAGKPVTFWEAAAFRPGAGAGERLRGNDRDPGQPALHHRMGHIRRGGPLTGRWPWRWAQPVS